jgi:hypothetical protein
MTGKERPSRVNSVSFKSKVACSNLYITVGVDKEGKPFEVFINGSKTGGCRTNQEALGRLTSALLRHGLLDEAKKQLLGLVCPSCQRWKGEIPKEERASYPSSCGDAVARALNDINKKEEDSEKK